MRDFGLHVRWCLLLLGALFCATAAAQSSRPAEPSIRERATDLEQEQRLLAKKFFQEAEASYKSGDFEAALAAYERAYLLTKEPLLLYNQAQCYRQLKRSKEAIDAYRRFLAEGSGDELYAAKAKKWLAALTEATPESAEGPSSAQAPASAASQPASAPVKPQPPSAPLPKSASLRERSAKGALVFGGLSLAASAGAGGAALLLGAKSRRLQGEPTDAEGAAAAAEKISRAREGALRFSELSDIALVGAALGAAGFLALRVAKKRDAAVVLSPAGAGLTVRF